MNSNGFMRIYYSSKAISFTLSVVLLAVIFSSCSLSRQINKQAGAILFKDSTINTGHIGISIYEPASGKYWYQHDATKYFIPASNVKLFTLYAVLKYTGDSIVGLRYQQKDSHLIIYPAADPTFLHPDFKHQPVYDFLKSERNIIYTSQKFADAFGQGWAWDDYLEKFMAQKSEFPIYGNLMSVKKNGNSIYVVPQNIPITFNEEFDNYSSQLNHFLYRKWDKNDLFVLPSFKDSLKDIIEVPLVINWLDIPQFLKDTLHQKIDMIWSNNYGSIKDSALKLYKIYSQPTDSLLKPMLFNSDNFFAEQSLLMISNEHLGYMNTAKIIDTLLTTDLIDVPQKPRWVDGSGLSRYNLFTPQSFIYILNKIKNEYGIERLKSILPTGGEGTLKNYFNNNIHFIYAKTGSMSNNTSLSGLLYSKKGKLLFFSILANQFIGSSGKVRHAAEKFLESLRDKY